MFGGKRGESGIGRGLSEALGGMDAMVGLSFRVAPWNLTGGQSIIDTKCLEDRFGPGKGSPENKSKLHRLVER